MRWVCLVAVAACSSGVAAPDVPAVTLASAPTPPPTPPPTPAAAPLLHRAITAIHGGLIDIIALTEDGGAAATADASGAVRLWPTLDGTREPVVVTAAAPAMLAVERDDSGFTVATVDAAGTLALARLAGTGDQRPSLQPELGQPVVALAAGTGAFYAVLADETVVELDPHGTRVETWSGVVGERVETVLVRGGHALALIESSTGTLLGRWLDHDHRATPTLAIDPASAALSPDGRHVASNRATRQPSVIVIDVATGQIVARPKCDRVIGYTDADTLACATGGNVVWWNQLGTRIGSVAYGNDGQSELFDDGTNVARSFVLAAVQHRVVGTFERGLALLAPDDARFVAYRVPPELAAIRDTPLGLVATAPPSDLHLVLGEDLHVARELPRFDDARDVVVVSDRAALVVFGHGDEAARELALIDLAQPRRRVVASPDIYDDHIAYEPATHLLGIVTDRYNSIATSVVIRQVDPDKLALGKPALLHVDSLTTSSTERITIHLLDPALASGALACVIEHRPQGARVTEVDAAPAGGAMHVRATYQLVGTLLAVDRAGRAYVHEGRDLVVRANGNEVSRIVGLGSESVVPSPDATELAVLLKGSVVVYAIDGTVRWQAPLWAASAITWHDGDLVAIAAGLVRLAGKDGHVVARQCGWQFGIWPTPPTIGVMAPLVCDAL